MQATQIRSSTHCRLWQVDLDALHSRMADEASRGTRIDGYRASADSDMWRRYADYIDQ